MTRTASIARNTKETQITLNLNLDGGEIAINTGIGFFDHMLTAFAAHGNFGLKVDITGDLQVDTHHTVEDAGIALGTAFRQALGTNPQIARFGSFFVPMDEALAFAAVDVSNRAYLVYDAVFPEAKCGDYDTCMTYEFFTAFANNAGLTLHMRAEYGLNSHHITEALFKAAAHAMRLAVVPREALLSTKGTL
ncbi:MAG: imidazoleglycerol-phosphate dehydratase HisB [Oscillospiraceae bacterium]|jgi:imidazoleglycerol-phosphate dehydratase|nr:imidazoleglycerol-phosphate dehydratase HisB [Oscillospiraceae bacterium]